MSHKKNKGKPQDPKPPQVEKRVQFPGSEENFVSVNEIDDNDYIDGSEQSIFEVRRDELISDQNVNISILKKYISPSLREVYPRPIIVKPCNQQPFDQTSLSARQLFDILRTSQAPTGVNMTLLNATYTRKLREVKKAIRNGADVNTVLEGQTPLLIATEFGDARLVSYLLTIPELNRDVQNRFGRTPLIIAVRNGFEQIVRLLLKNDADVNLADHMGKTPLHCALFLQHLGLVKLLLAFGANYEKSDCFGEKPMYTAAVKKPNYECIMTLLRIGAMPDHNTASGVSLLSRTILNGSDFNIIEILVKHGASVNAQSLVSKKTPLHFAAFMNNLKVAEVCAPQLLVREGADVNLKTIYNFTPLDEANFQRSLEVKFYLLDLGLRNSNADSSDSIIY